jgi:hypothetical protein
MSYRAFANISALLGKPALAATYHAKAASVTQQLNAQFLDEETAAYGVGGPIGHDSNLASPRYDPYNASQCGQGMALFMQLVPPALRSKALAVMASNARDETANLPPPQPGNPESADPLNSYSCKGFDPSLHAAPRCRDLPRPWISSNRCRFLCMVGVSAHGLLRVAPDLLPPCRSSELEPLSFRDCGGGPGAHMTAGLFSIKWFLMSLADGGENDLAYETLTTPSYPGFKWMMHNSIDNATTIW